MKENRFPVADQAGLMHFGIHVKPVNKHDDHSDDDGIIDKNLFQAWRTVMEQPGHSDKQNADEPDRQQSDNGINQ
jgi:hypothetical protein